MLYHLVCIQNVCDYFAIVANVQLPQRLCNGNFVNCIRIECSRPITFNISDFKRRQSLEETLKPNENVKRKAGDVPFQNDIEFTGNSIV